MTITLKRLLGLFSVLLIGIVSLFFFTSREMESKNFFAEKNQIKSVRTEKTEKKLNDKNGDINNKKTVVSKVEAENLPHSTTNQLNETNEAKNEVTPVQVITTESSVIETNEAKNEVAPVQAITTESSVIEKNESDTTITTKEVSTTEIAEPKTGYGGWLVTGGSLELYEDTPVYGETSKENGSLFILSKGFVDFDDYLINVNGDHWYSFTLTENGVTNRYYIAYSDVGH